VHSMTMKTAATPRKVTSERARHAAMWRLGYAEAKPPLRLVCEVFGVSAPTVIKAVRQLKNGNGHTPAPLTIDDISRWWFAVTDADRAALMKSIGVGSAWRAIKANLG
jgi:hypothetical protein